MDLRDSLTRLFDGDPRVTFAVLFGSFATGRVHAHSDVDVAVSFAGDGDAWLDLIGDVDAAVGRSDARGRPVDVVRFDEAGPGLRHRALHDGVVLSCRDRVALTAARARAALEYADFRPFEERMIEGVRRRARHGR